MLVPLLVLDAEVELASKPNGSLAGAAWRWPNSSSDRAKPDAARPSCWPACASDAAGRNHYARFFKFGTRPALDISTITIGIAGTLKDGALSLCARRSARWRRSRCARRAPSRPGGERLDAQAWTLLANVARDEVTPIDDIRASAWYRKELIHNITKRMLNMSLKHDIESN
jgi:CO/xanthine dehydrogenase FAD-binding subunit